MTDDQDGSAFDWSWAKTPQGGQYHLVNFTDPDALAMGQPPKSNYSSLCGEVPARWDQVINDPVVITNVCYNCCRTAVRLLDRDAQDFPNENIIRVAAADDGPRR